MRVNRQCTVLFCHDCCNENGRMHIALPLGSSLGVLRGYNMPLLHMHNALSIVHILIVACKTCELILLRPFKIMFDLLLCESPSLLQQN